MGWEANNENPYSHKIFQGDVIMEPTVISIREFKSRRVRQI